MNQNGYQQYKTQSINTMTKAEMLILLYDELIKRLIDTIEIKRDKNYNIEITNIKFTEEFISKSSNEFIKYLYVVLKNDNVGIKYLNEITKEELETKKKAQGS